MNSKWVILAALSWVFANYHAARIMIHPILPVLKEETHLSYAGLGLLSTGYDIGYGLTLLLGGYLADRLNRRYLVSFGLLWLALWKLVTSFSSSLIALISLRVLTGISFSTYFGAGLSLIAEFFPPNERGKAMGIHAMAAGLGRSLAFPLTGMLVVKMGWRAPFFWFSLVALSASILFWCLASEPRTAHPQGAKPNPNQGRVLDLLKSPVLMMVGLVYCLTIACAVGEGPFLMLYLVDVHRLSLEYASSLIGLCQITTVLFTFLATSLSDTYGRKRILVGVLALSTVSYLLFTVVEPGIWLVLLLIFGIGDIVAASMILQTAMTEVAPAHRRGTALGYMNTWGVITGFGAGPALGYVSDLFGLRLVFIVMAIIAAICIPLTAKLK
jgi:sugar phosphate permease